jgi:tRNA threonylcarbamoyladenosine biosynthesis protein TsaB
MIILTVRTDKPKAEICLYDDSRLLARTAWHAHRQLAETLHQKIVGLLEGQGKNLHELQGIACYKGPGSFTGLRIGLSVANALAYGLDISIAGDTGDDWQQISIGRLAAGESDTVVLPEYGADVHITAPKH